MHLADRWGLIELTVFHVSNLVSVGTLYELNGFSTSKTSIFPKNPVIGHFKCKESN